MQVDKYIRHSKRELAYSMLSLYPRRQDSTASANNESVLLGKCLRETGNLNTDLEN